MLRDFWKCYCCLVRECFGVNASLKEMFVARFMILSLHAMVVCVLLWWLILAHFAWLLVKALAS